MSSRSNISMNLNETEKKKTEVLDKSKIGNPKAGHVRVVTSTIKGAGFDRRQVFDITDCPVKIDGKDNPIVLRYLRKFEAKNRNQAVNNIVDIILPPDFKAPKMSDDFILSGKDKGKEPLTGVTMESFMEAFMKAMAEKK